MAGIGDAARSSGDVMYRLAELERMVRDLQTARRLESASIGAGGLRVKGGRILAENAGSQRIFEVATDPPEIFLEEDLVSSLVARISQSVLAEGIEADARIAQGTTTTEDTWVDLTFAGNPDPGPSVDVNIATGVAIAFSHAQIDVQNFTNAWMHFQISGATSRQPTTLGAANVRAPSGASIRVGSTGIDLVTGLNPGAHTFTSKYRVSNLDIATFSNRVLLVIPF